MKDKTLWFIINIFLFFMMWVGVILGWVAMAVFLKPLQVQLITLFSVSGILAAVATIIISKACSSE